MLRQVQFYGRFTPGSVAAAAAMRAACLGLVALVAGRDFSIPLVINDEQKHLTYGANDDFETVAARFARDNGLGLGEGCSEPGCVTRGIVAAMRSVAEEAAPPEASRPRGRTLIV